MENNLEFLVLPTFWNMTSEKDIEIAEMLGKQPEEKLEEGIVYVNPLHIVYYNEGSDGTTTLGINGTTFKIKMNIEVFGTFLYSYKKAKGL